MVQKKGEVRVFVDGLYLRVIDDLIHIGYGTNRSEVVRKMIHDWVMKELGFKGLMKYPKRKSSLPSAYSVQPRRNFDRG